MNNNKNGQPNSPFEDYEKLPSSPKKISSKYMKKIVWFLIGVWAGGILPLLIVWALF